MRLITYYIVAKGVKRHAYLSIVNGRKRWTKDRQKALHLPTETDALCLCKGRKGAFVIMVPYMELVGVSDTNPAINNAESIGYQDALRKAEPYCDCFDTDAEKDAYWRGYFEGEDDLYGLYPRFD